MTIPKLVEKWLKKKELDAQSKCDYIAGRIDALLEISDYLITSEFWGQSSVYKAYGEKQVNPNPYILLPYLGILMHAYYQTFQDLERRWSGEVPTQTVVAMPDFVSDGTLEKLRHAFAHPEMPTSKMLSSIRAFEENYSTPQLLSEFRKIRESISHWINEASQRIVINRIETDDLHALVKQYPRSKLARYAAEQGRL